ncbi:MAG: acyl-CoA dehydrogenase family protein [Candidatus Promineifilaceae bacterium]
MISFEIPEHVRKTIAFYTDVAENAMRPPSRELDENEHERPVKYIEAMWPLIKQEYRERIEALSADATPQQQTDGTNWDRLVTILTVEQLSWGDAGQYLCRPTPSLGGAAVEAVGTRAQKLRLYERWTHDPPKWGSMAITEAAAGSDNSSMRTTAVLDQATNEWVLNGEKLFITNGKLALEDSNGFCVVWATIDPAAGRAGIKSFVVEAGTPGVMVSKREHKFGIRVSDTVVLSFSDARIPYDNLLGSAEIITKKSRAKGFKGAMATFNSTRPGIAASAMGVARATIELTTEILAEQGIRVDYEKPAHLWTAVERDLVEMEARYKAAWNLTLLASGQMVHGVNNRMEASMCKYRAGEAVNWITQKAVELLGPLGYTHSTLVEKWMRDAKINEIYEGTRQINQLIVARSLLGYSRRELR